MKKNLLKGDIYATLMEYDITENFNTFLTLTFVSQADKSSNVMN